MEPISFDIQNGIAGLTLNRPEKFNSFNREMALMLQKYLDECAENDAVRCLYITGAGKAFCAGQDLAEATDPQGPAMERIVEEHYNPIIRKIRSIEKPVIAGVNGVAAGAGANIALACDIVLAASSASFIQAFSKIGLIPDSAGTFFLPRVVGEKFAAELLMTGDAIEAERALRIGMINRVVPAAELMLQATELAQKLAAGPTAALGRIKKMINASYSNDLRSQLALEAECQLESGRSPDFREGVTAFFDKRAANFSGR